MLTAKLRNLPAGLAALLAFAVVASEVLIVTSSEASSEPVFDMPYVFGSMLLIPETSRAHDLCRSQVDGSGEIRSKELGAGTVLAKDHPGGTEQRSSFVALCAAKSTCQLRLLAGPGAWPDHPISGQGRIQKSRMVSCCTMVRYRADWKHIKGP
jgi:hypothetical protein